MYSELKIKYAIGSSQSTFFPEAEFDTKEEALAYLKAKENSEIQCFGYIIREVFYKDYIYEEEVEKSKGK